MNGIDPETIAQRARELGFEAIGVVRAERYAGAPALERWLDAGYHAGMAWMTKGVERRLDPREVLPEARCVLVVWMRYGFGVPEERAPGTGRVARYAVGLDYHDLMLARLRELAAVLEDPLARAYVDTGPVLERSVAEQAGLGWIGKNGCVIHPQRGSYGFLGTILTARELPLTEGPHAFRCGSCTRCLEVCPTGALVEPGVVDAGRCISYLTIEHRGPVPEELRHGMGPWVFGCDLCQEVCPWNRRETPSEEAAYMPRAGNPYPRLEELLLQTQEEFAERFRGSPLKRAKRAGLARNAAIAMGNAREAGHVVPLTGALGADPDPVVRGAAAWALGQIATGEAIAALVARVAVEGDEVVRAEVGAALERAKGVKPAR